MGAGDGLDGAEPERGPASGEEHVVVTRDWLGKAVLSVGAGFALVFAAGLWAESGALEIVGLGGVVVFYVLVRADTRPSSVRSLAFAADGVTATVRGGDPVRWSSPAVVGIGVRGPTRAGFLAPVRTFSGPIRTASVVLLDDAGRVVDAPSVSWMRLRDLETAVGAAGLGWAGRLAFHPVPSVPVAPPEDGGLDVAGSLVAQDPHVDDALADHEGPSLGMRIGIVVGLAVAVTAVSLVVQTAALVIPGIVLVIGATVLFVVDAVLDRVRRRATQTTIDEMRDHMRWTAAECIVLDVPPTAPSQEGVVVLGPDGDVVAGLRLESAPAWLRAHRRRWLLVAHDPTVRRGVVALPDRSRATPVDARSFDLRLVAAWMTGPDAVASRDGRSAWPGVPTGGVDARAVRHHGDDADDGGR